MPSEQNLGLKFTLYHKSDKRRYCTYFLWRDCRSEVDMLLPVLTIVSFCLQNERFNLSHAASPPSPAPFRYNYKYKDLANSFLKLCT
jgi:hypothetical protein